MVMLVPLFLVCASIGGAVLICQFVLALVGFGGHGDVVDGLGHDIPHDFNVDSHADGHDASSADQELGQHGVGHGNLSTWIFGVLSFKTVTEALAFFGLAGCAANAAQMGSAAQLTIALAAGAFAMYGVHWIMRSIYRLSEDHTIRIERAVGRQGTVYLTIPADRKGAGKVQLKVQNRLMDYVAVTDHDQPLLTGSRIRVTGVSGGSTLQVLPWIEPKPAAAEQLTA